MINDSGKHANAVVRVVQGPDPQGTPALCVFALKDIAENCEIRYDYGGSDLKWRQVPGSQTLLSE